MPYTAVTHAPYAPGSDTSRDAARRIKPQTQMERMRLLYAECGYLTDHDMHDITGYPINVITARRNALGCKPVGKRMGPHGVRVTAWALEER